MSERKSSNVPGQFLGYSLQATELLRQLLQSSPGTIVSVEAFEDVGSEAADGTQVATQTKSATATNPIADRSVEWWKTFAIWIRWCKANPEKIANRSFHLHVFSPKPSNLVQKFSDAKDAAQAIAALLEARKEMWGNPPAYELKAKLAKSVAPDVNAVLETEDSVLTGVIQRFSLTVGGGNIRQDLHNLFLKLLTPDEYVVEVCDKALGWVKNEIDVALQKRDVASIPFDDFRREINAFVGKLLFKQMLYDFAGEVGTAAVDEHRYKMYVRQMQVVGAKDEDILEAINSFLRASVNRSKWSEKLLVDPDAWDAFEKALSRFWENTRKQQDLDHLAEAEEKRGMRLLLACLSHRAKLHGREVPDDFTPGSFHALSDDQDVGWHPQYKAKLKEQI